MSPCSSYHSMHPTSSPVVSRMLATGTWEDGRQRVDGSAQTITTLNNSRACSGVDESPAAMGEWRSDRCRDAGCCSHNLHAGGSRYWSIVSGQGSGTHVRQHPG